MKVLRKVYALLRSLVVPLLCLLVVVPVMLYIALSISGVQNRIARVAESELSNMLGAQVKIGSLGIVPFSRVILRNVEVIAAEGDTVLTARRLGASVSWGQTISTDAITITSVELIEANARLWRDSLQAPLNIQPIIDALAPKDKTKPPTKFSLKINTVILRSTDLSYDVLSEPETSGRFNAHHLHISNLRADMRMPKLKNNNFAINIKRMAGDETSTGIYLQNLTANAMLNDSLLRASNVTLSLPQSSLAFEDISLPLSGLNSIPNALRHTPVHLAVKPGSHIAMADVAPFIPDVYAITGDFTLQIRELEADGCLDKISARAHLEAERVASLQFEGSAVALTQPEHRLVNVEGLRLSAESRALVPMLQAAGVRLQPAAAKAWTDMGAIMLSGDASLKGNEAGADLTLTTAYGAAEAAATAKLSDSWRLMAFDADFATKGPFHTSGLAGPSLGAVDLAVSAAYSAKGRKSTGSINADVKALELCGVMLTDIQGEGTLNGREISANISSRNPQLDFDIAATYSDDPKENIIDVEAAVQRFVPSAFGWLPSIAGMEVAADIDVDLRGTDRLHLPGHVMVSNLALHSPDRGRLDVKLTRLDVMPEELRLSGDLLEGSLKGSYDYRYIAKDAEHMLCELFPLLSPHGKNHTHNHLAADANAFHFDFTLNQTESLANFFHLPVSVIYPAKISGYLDSESNSASLVVDMPFLRQGKKLVEDTRLVADVDGLTRQATIDFNTTMPGKHGQMMLNLNAAGGGDNLGADLRWKVARASRYEGGISLEARLRPAADEDAGFPAADITINRSNLTFNDSTWVLGPATISVENLKDITINGLNAHQGDRYVKISGRVSDNPLDQLVLSLSDFSIDYLFEALSLVKVKLGGNASGTFYASQLLSGAPAIETPGLKVNGISFNNVVIGDALIRSHFDTETRGIALDADIAMPHGRKSTVLGGIYPFNDSIDITFNVDHANVGFLRPYMQTFASSVGGEASGRARLFGNFKNIDLEGDLKADSLSMKVTFTNTRYTVLGDSVHIRPGKIDLSGITIHDTEGHTAQLNGWLTHRYFKPPTAYEFSITDARNFLSYNETAKQNPVWNGKIYGNGSVFIKGDDDRVDVTVDMATAPGSRFAFVLSDMEVAGEYSFLTFRDKESTMVQVADTVQLANDTKMEIVNRLRSIVNDLTDESAADFNLNLQVRVNPQARIDLVMDPVAGDRIRAWGSGHLRLEYGSATEEIKMYGTYTLEKGDYNFTLQDIIIKDFSINPGSRIVFNGDPLSAQLDIEAVYALNANLSDLDESFLQDKELNRTNVPVHAVMKVQGDMRQPDIAFDLAFPTLSNDIYRKVKSIVSTEDMMNRQIIYLLALNRFYTPEYMASTTKGNELVSVASSTISSQLRSLLGQISDNWSIAPSIRSDRGDFSDVEVDVALSSSLLNNRLLFNGNFGYRDKSLNTNQFIGDFDLEYLLDRTGKWRLKAYNRYNDQNYYLRSAQTTQGVGVMLKQDFDSFTSWIHRARRQLQDNKTTEKSVK